MREDRSVLDLMTADYTFVNERLARHYGIPGIYGSQFRRVPVTDDARKGLLGQGSILAVTSHAERTSPVVRGKWILENLLGIAGAAAAARRSAAEGEERRREAADHARADGGASRQPGVRGCHKMHGLRSASRWRTSTRWARGAARMPATRSMPPAMLADGTKVNGVVELRNALLSQSGECSSRHVTEKLLTYALGRGLDYRDMPAVRAIVRDAAHDNYQFSSLVTGRGPQHAVPDENGGWTDARGTGREEVRISCS